MKPTSLGRAGLLVTLLPFTLAGVGAKAATGTIQDVQHVVIFFQENRSFDHYYGALKGVRGFGDPNALVFPNGNSIFYQPQGVGFILPFPTNSQCVVNYATSWTECHIEWNGGRWDQWVTVAGVKAMPYYERAHLPFYYALIDAYTICDAYHCSVLGATTPNRLYLMTGMNDPNGNHGGPVIGNSPPPPDGFTWTTYPERLQGAGISWKVYQQNTDFMSFNVLSWFAPYKKALPGNPLYDRGLVLVTNLVEAFRSDVVNGTLPKVSWIMPPWTFSEHPCYSPANGQQLTSQLLQALASNPSICNSTVFILAYDEAGGFFDHVPSPTPTPGTADEFIGGEPVGLGIRVPMILISPWTRGGYVCSQLFDHTSVLRFLERWTGVREPNISAWRRQVCGDLTAAFDFEHPNTNAPTLPAITGVICTDCETPTVPSVQTFPVQESGSKPARPLPYQPNAFAVAHCATGELFIVMTNAGSVSIHFAIYANVAGGDGPWQYDVLPASSTVARFTGFTNGAAQYDFTCYGPNGFNRRFAGSLWTNCSLVEVTPTIDLAAGGLRVDMQNSTASDVTFTLANAWPTGSQRVYVVSAGGVASDTFNTLTNNGWYDIIARVDNEAGFLRRFAGHIEMPAPVSKLTATCSGTNLVLTYPGSVTNTLESTPGLTPVTWTAVNAKPVIIGSNAVVSLPVLWCYYVLSLAPVKAVTRPHNA